MVQFVFQKRSQFANVENMLIVLLIIKFGYFDLFCIFSLLIEKKYFTLRR